MLYSVRKGLSSFVCFPPFSAFFFLVFFRIEGICGSNRVRLALFHFAVKKSSKFSKTENCLVFAINNFFSSLRKEMKTFLLLRKTSSSSSSSSFRRYCYYSLSRRQTLLNRRVSKAQNSTENNSNDEKRMTTKTFTFNKTHEKKKKKKSDDENDDDVNNGVKKNKIKTFTLRPKERHGTNEKARYVTLHFLRHAEGTHNVSREYNDPKLKDARLTDFGIKQCEKLAKAQPLLLEKKSSKKKMTVATSPMTRCVQTARLCFDKESHMITEKYVALEELRETVNYQCDIRRTTSELKEEFGASVDFSRLENDEEDPLWQYWIERCGSEEEHTMHRESASLYKCADRARKFFEWVVEKKADTEEEIIVSSHSAFLRCVFNYGHTQEKFEYHMGGSEQVFDDREDKTNNVKVVQYLPEDGDAFEEYMRRDYENCELRSAVLEIL